MIRSCFGDEIRAEHPVKRVCGLLGWGKSSYYGWKDRQPARDASIASQVPTIQLSAIIRPPLVTTNGR